MSSVLGLKASPQSAMRLPARPAPKRALIFAPSTCFCASFTCSTAPTSVSGRPASFPVRCRALTSLGKQEPPKPAPAYRKSKPMRGSEPMPCRTSSMSAPSRSARLASSFMNEMRVASMALAAYLVSSAERTLICRMRSRLRWNGAYSWRSSAVARSSSEPRMMRSGRMKSSTAAPSLRNSGLDTTQNAWFAPRLASSSATAARTLSAVPTGTVDLFTITRSPLMWRPMARAAASTCCRSAEPSSSDGVPTAMSCNSPCAPPAAASVVNRSRPAARLRATMASSPGS